MIPWRVLAREGHHHVALRLLRSPPTPGHRDGKLSIDHGSDFNRMCLSPTVFRRMGGHQAMVVEEARQEWPLTNPFLLVLLPHPAFREELVIWNQTRAAGTCVFGLSHLVAKFGLTLPCPPSFEEQHDRPEKKHSSCRSGSKSVQDVPCDATVRGSGQDLVCFAKRLKAPRGLRKEGSSIAGQSGLDLPTTTH